MGDKKTYGVRLEDKFAEMYNELHSKLGGNKYRIIEASLEIFSELPSVLQRCLVSYDEEERKLILGIIGQLKPPPEPKKGGKKR